MAEKQEFSNIVKALKSITTDEVLDSLHDYQLKELRDILDCTSAGISFRLKQRTHQSTHFRPKSKN